MPIVSILIPAYKTAYLDKAIASTLNQTLQDIEILIGDDTADGRLGSIVARFNDPRVQYFHHGFGNLSRNAQALWERARGQYVKWLHDDDVLMPTSVESLVASLRMYPDSALAFHGRVIIDSTDALKSTPTALLKAGEVGQILRESLVEEMVGKLDDFIGGASNVMLVRESIAAAHNPTYRSWDLDCLNDVAMYLDAAELGPVVVVGGYLGGTREHPGQRAGGTSVYKAASLYEWELMVRAEAAAGRLSSEGLAMAQERLKEKYAAQVDALPELSSLHANLDDLTRRPVQELLEDPLFQANLAQARASVTRRKAAATAPANAAGSTSEGAALPPRKPIRLVVATRTREEDFMTKTALGRSLSLYRHKQPPQLQLFANNTTGLSTLYNSAIDYAKEDPAILLFIHDDISICDFFWVDRIHDAIERFDVVGLAGNKRRVPGQPAWAFPAPDFKWDAMENLSGVVGHGKGFPCDIVTVYGPPGQPCKLLDGLFLAADSTRLNAAGVRFDDQFEFHFYDLDFCRQAEAGGLSIGTWGISVIHESPGAYNSEAWREGYRRYLRKYGE